MRIVVTGAKGFVGSVLTQRAAELGHHVLALDSGARGLNAVSGPSNVRFMQHDCMGGILKAVHAADWQEVNAVFHLAAATGSLEKPLEELCRFNVGMTKEVYRDALALEAKAFLWPTTSLALAVPDSPYVESKERGRKWLLEADKDNHIAVPVRFFNCTGEYKGMTEVRKQEVHILPVMMDCFLNSRPFTINGNDWDTSDGTPSRDFVNVVDVVEEMIFLAQHRIADRDPDAFADRLHRDDTIWFGTGQSTTVLDVVHLFERFIGPVQHQFGPRRGFDCGALEMDVFQRKQFVRSRGMLVPPWISIRDELLMLEARKEELDVLGPQKAA